MKTKPRRFPCNIFKAACWSLILTAGFLTSINSRADGCFVVPKFVWDKHKDINEPTQKAIIAFDSGHEDLILQVKYDGHVEEFGWLVPVPNLPTVKESSMDCFYELSKLTQKTFDYDEGGRKMSTASLHSAGPEPEPPVKVIEIKTVGAYEVAILSARDAGALESWLNANQFSVPEDKLDVIDSYVKKSWYFVAAKINLSKAAGFQIISGTPKTGVSTGTKLEEKISNGELHPLHLSFASAQCVFPLKISSVNGKPSEVQVYVLSVEPLVEKTMFEQRLAANFGWRTNMIARRDEALKRQQMMRERFQGSMAMISRPSAGFELSSQSAIDDDALFPYMQVGRKEIPACSREISLPGGQQRWLTKLTFTFKPEEMRDLEFSPAIPEFVAHLQDGEGAFAAASLAQLGTKGMAALLLAMDDPNPQVRAHATSVLNDSYEKFNDSQIHAGLMKRLPALFQDTDPEVRFHAIQAAEESGDKEFFDPALKLLRDDYPEVSGSALMYLTRQPGEGTNHTALLHDMIKDTNPIVQMAGLRMLHRQGQPIPRAELLPLFSVPRMEVAAVAYQMFPKGSVSCEDAKPLLQNSDGMVRLLGLRVLGDNENKDSVKFAIPLLRDPLPAIGIRAQVLLSDLTGQKFPADQPDQWEKWWSENQATFVVDGEQLAQRRDERFRERRDAVTRRNAAEVPSGR